jgi:hypothetical protein
VELARGTLPLHSAHLNFTPAFCGGVEIEATGQPAVTCPHQDIPGQLDGSATGNVTRSTARRLTLDSQLMTNKETLHIEIWRIGTR